MYVFYEHHKDAHGKIVLTELKLSTYDNFWAISFKNQLEKVKFDLIKPMLKSEPIAFWSYDPDLKVWSYLEGRGVDVLKKVEAVVAPLGGVTLLEVEDLASLASVQGNFNYHKQRKKVSTEDFFYNHGVAAATPVLTKEQIREKLAPLLETNTAHLNSIESNKDAMKKLYRHAALRLHPDRNNGDGSKMSDLNMYWGLYNG